ncbi:MAG: hypothetical protein L3J39_08585 [Verrucomicrobiales bacterium]|nr:hypothetical protein [Verrucomicrobiales bacterium]
MPQLQLPIFRDGVTQITSELGYAKEDGQLVFYNGSLPIFSHEESDLGSFKMILSQLKKQRKLLSKHIEYKELPEGESFLQLATRSKQFIDTIKIIAYRAETAMADFVRTLLGKHHKDEARTYIKKLYQSETNLVPDEKNGTLTVEIHSLATPKENKILKKLCEEINLTQTEYPNTKMKLIHKMVL